MKGGPGEWTQNINAWASEERRCAHPHRDNRCSSRRPGKNSSRRRRARRPLPVLTPILTAWRGTFRVEVRSVQRTVVPDRCDARLSLFHEGKSQERAALHGVAERAAAIRGLGHLLKLADRFFE